MQFNKECVGARPDPGLAMKIKKVLVIFVGVIILYVMSIYIRAYFWEKQAAQYATEALSAIARPWSAGEFFKRASTTLPKIDLDARAELMPQMTEAAAIYVGRMVKIIGEPDCNLYRAYYAKSKSKEEFTFASCPMKVEFEKKTCPFGMILVEENDKWRIATYDLTTCLRPD